MTMKKNILIKILSLSLALVILAGMLFACGGPEDQNKNKQQEEEDIVNYITTNDVAKIWAAPDTVSVMQDLKVDIQCEYWGEEWLENSDKLACEGIKGDVEAVQVMITAKKDIAKFNLTAGELTLVGGEDTIPVENIEVLAERYIEVTAPSSKPKTASMFSGWYPDALVPIASYVGRRENNIKKDNNQGIWLNITIPQDATAGTYQGTCVLKLDSISVNLPLEVKVYDVAMPTTVHARTAIDIWYDQILRGELSEDEEGNTIEWSSIYYDYLLSKRITPQCTLLIKENIPDGASYTPYVEEMVAIAQDERIPCFKMPYKATSVPEIGSVVDSTVLVGLLTAMAEKNIQLRLGGDGNTNLFEKAYIYLGSIIDEPGVSKLPAVRYCDLAITNAKKDVAELLNDYPDLKASCLAIPHLVTTRINDSYAGDEEQGGVQTWCCEAQNWGSNVTQIKERRESTERYSQGEGFWIYLTCNSNNPYPSLQLDDNLMGVRTIFWMNYNYNISGLLFWNSVYYSQHAQGESITRDVWNNPLSWDNANGDGHLLYPGSRYGLYTPISTLRLESMRQGTEDYEYFYMLGEALTSYNLAHSTDYDIDKVLSSINNAAYINGSVVARTNINKFMTARSRLLELLEAVVNDYANAGELLNNYQSLAK